VSGEGARIIGGRWNPPDSFPAVYLALDVPTVEAEFYRAAARQAVNPAALLPRELHRYEVAMAALLDLRDQDAREAVHLGKDDIRGDDLGACQAIGEAAHYLGREGLLAPSAAGTGVALVVFTDRLRPGSHVNDIAHELWQDLP
jgi:RES domain-containing protein